MWTQNQGISLIEMAITLIIVSLLLGSLLSPLPTQIEAAHLKHTQSQLETIKQALLGYVVLNGFLPCPDVDRDGIGDRETAQQCVYEYQEGWLPWLELGVAQYDTWGRLFRYRVDSNFNNQQGITHPITTFDQLTLITTDYSTPYQLKTQLLNTTQPDSNIIAIIFSCGQNGRPDGNNDRDGLINNNRLCDNPGAPTHHIYTQQSYRRQQFDDVVTWVPKTILTSQLVASHHWPNP